MLIGKNIHKSFNGLEVLKGVDLNIEKSSITSIIGKSGTGKTTLIRALTASNIEYMTADGAGLMPDSCALDFHSSNAVLAPPEKADPFLQVFPRWCWRNRFNTG